VATLDTPGNATDLAISGAIVYIADENFGLQIVDVSNTTQPSIVGNVYAPGLLGVRGVTVRDPLVYFVARDAGMFVVNAADPRHPEIVGHVDNPASSGRIVTTSSYAYISNREGDGGMVVVDIRNPASPRIVGCTDTPGLGGDLALFESTILLADEFSGIHVLRTQCEGGTAAPEEPRDGSPVLASWPNPATNTVWFRTRHTVGIARLELHDVVGRLVRRFSWNLEQQTGSPVIWDGTNERGERVGSGVYFARLTGSFGTERSRVLLVR
jgi:hypothetical protein